MMFEIGTDKMGMVGSTWFDDDGRLVIELDDREVARVNPVEAAGVFIMLKKALKEQGFEDDMVEQVGFFNADAEMVQ